MTEEEIRRASRITGLDVHRGPSGVPCGVVYGKDDGEVVVSVTDSADSYNRFLISNLERIGWITMQAQNFRCAGCGRIRALQKHHIKHRSKERDDRRENIEMLCLECHNQEHGK